MAKITPKKVIKATKWVVSPAPKKKVYRCDPEYGGCGGKVKNGNLCMRCIKRRR